ncbi:MAG: hypothetical protein COB15_04195 [Flavobacteriales bacterium]|nr:MAG: hypothetical protein COB15_04195 [Flavobacteriales bacterium]
MQLAVKITILFTILFFVGCSKEDPEPAPPTITFLDARLSDDKLYSVIRFEFFDADGDLGLKQKDTIGEYDYNVLIDYYEKVNGVWVLKSPVITWNTAEARYDTLELHLRFPFLENEAQRSLQGEIKLDLLFNFNADTFRYDLHIKDRAFNTSNVITTTELIVN